MQSSGNPSPRWSHPREIPAVCLCRANLAKTVVVAVAVGTILFAINQLDVVLAGRATGVTWLKVALTYAVPFCVSNYGILVASRGTPEHADPGGRSPARPR